ncbi:hypothetical protein [Arsenophonus endosymbiont of Bemisia tabaci]|uniref:hypothetical protein n=1 Tax=Arsenophonus endosymbiont of Bemisia tabaci TaxID=536059 RepID=UPI0015F45388|nr:hypothetical protein [Arsenophonus endosymbiont of Bemisia tabaci]
MALHLYRAGLINRAKSIDYTSAKKSINPSLQKMLNNIQIKLLKKACRAFWLRSHIWQALKKMGLTYKTLRHPES